MGHCPRNRAPPALHSRRQAAALVPRSESATDVFRRARNTRVWRLLLVRRPGRHRLGLRPRTPRAHSRETAGRSGSSLSRPNRPPTPALWKCPSIPQRASAFPARRRGRPPSSSTRRPRPLRDGRNELLQPPRRKLERRALLGALICGHEDFHNVEAVVERRLGLLLTEEHAHEMAVFGVVSVGGRFVREDRADADLSRFFFE